jgi:Ca2+/H+ antiporter, TMEM165/GDT1 family
LTAATPAVSAAFLGSLVEAVEALTILLAAATVRGWRRELAGLFIDDGSLALAILGVVLLAGLAVAAMPDVALVEAGFYCLVASACCLRTCCEQAGTD